MPSAVAAGVIQLNEPGDPPPFVLFTAVVIHPNVVDAAQLPLLFHALVAIVHQPNEPNEPDIPSPFVLHAAIPIQQDVLHVDTLLLHIFLTVPYFTETLSLHQRFGQEVYDYDSVIVDCV